MYIMRIYVHTLLYTASFGVSIGFHEWRIQNRWSIRARGSKQNIIGIKQTYYRSKAQYYWDSKNPGGSTKAYYWDQTKYSRSATECVHPEGSLP